MREALKTDLMHFLALAVLAWLLTMIAFALSACAAEVETAPPSSSTSEGGAAGAPPCAAGSHHCDPDRPVALVCDEGYTPPGDCISRLTAHCCAP